MEGIKMVDSIFEIGEMVKLISNDAGRDVTIGNLYEIGRIDGDTILLINNDRGRDTWILDIWIEKTGCKDEHKVCTYCLYTCIHDEICPLFKPDYQKIKAIKIILG